MTQDGDTVDASEKAAERSQEAKAPKFHKPPDMKPVTKERIKNFTCTDCGELLPEVIALNGFIQGECGRSHRRMKVPI